MPRKARLDAPGALHHIIVRGIEQCKIFTDDADRCNFLDRLGDILVDTKTPCFGWALIPNHAHILLQSGSLPLATVMRRLLTGYAVSFNRRHRRWGHLFQNRYKSILCQENKYLLELVRYIHLNPLRAKLVTELKTLDYYAFCGHSAIMDKKQREWQDVDYVLRLFGDKRTTARRGYREFIQKGIEQGHRPDLVGGGLVRSAGGWSAVKLMHRSSAREKGDERILGDGDFVEQMLAAGRERLERRYYIKAQGYDFNGLVNRVAQLLDMQTKDVLASGKHPPTVKARSLLCYWATRELGITTIELSQKLRLSQPTISVSAKRGEKIAAENEFKLLEE